MECINRIHLPELLAPAGSMEHLKAAIKAGADAVYMGGERFGARAYADNLREDNLREALRYTHFHGRRLYLTVNTLMKEKEINHTLFGFLRPYYEAGLDGVIVQDFGTASFIHRCFPDLDIHASTQMSITSVEGACAAKRMGMNRVVPARELSLREIREMKKAGLEVEVFIHGALCYGYSGQCLFSSMYGGRSGNRGRCAQPCRLPYQYGRNAAVKKTPSICPGQSGYLLSPKDLCGLPLLPDFILAGADSFKIEGRMKNVDYVAGVTAIYRKYLDLCGRLAREGKDLRSDYSVQEEDVRHLEELYSRGGFTEGYLYQHNGREMISLRYPRNLGRPIGTVCGTRKYQVEIRLTDPIYPRDILVIPARDKDEIILTVPSNVGSGDKVLLNLPPQAYPKKGMAVWRRRNEPLSVQIKKNILDREIKYPVKGHIVIHPRKPAVLTLNCEGQEIMQKGPVVETAQKKALTLEDVKRQMNKTGNVPFYLEGLAADLAPGSFLPMSVLKKLRRDGFSSLLEARQARGERAAESAVPPPIHKIIITGKRPAETSRQVPLEGLAAGREYIAAVYHRQSLREVLRDDFFTGFSLPMDFWNGEELVKAAEDIRKTGKKALLSLPYIFRQDADDWSNIYLSDVWDGIYVHNINEAELLSREKKLSVPLFAGASLYQWNSWAVHTVRQLFDIQASQMPMEISREEFQDINAALKMDRADPVPWEWVVYGRTILMLSAQCVKNTVGICDHKPSQMEICDRKGRILPVTAHCRYGYSRLWSDEARNLIGEECGEAVQNIHRFYFDFFFAKPEEISAVKKQFKKWERSGFHRDPMRKDRDEHWNYGIK